MEEEPCAVRAEAHSYASFRHTRSPDTSQARTSMPTGDTGGFLPRWTVKTGGVVAPDERLPWGQTVVLGVQHVFAMFGATVLVPILMGFDPNTAIFFSGIGTLIFFVVVGGRGA